ncbi:hypothetical protein M501DRAFT_962511 [Patellaria atrata CBS 101060]|uniref:Inosine/uridine-preferring nucleoside hydrolase domain-containing protein n=1 Tax=Patellaria atrata CBS 101060 TaxID=1346257 RepID=A0A9P4S5L4_9PEZI|nr:hypothetical protein M501DRAFT_962511 [Patellaria atrata CBS 101060]
MAVRSFLLWLWIFQTTFALPSRPHHTPQRLIIDTDLLNFVDDPLALGLANIFQSHNEIQILGIVSSISSRYAPPAIDAINTFYKHPSIPLAIQKPVDNSTIDPNYPEYPEYLTGLTHRFDQDINDGSNTTDPVSLYRKLLACAPDASVKIAVIGFHDNLYHLLRSRPDAISPLSGRALVKQKVAELIVGGTPSGMSFNFVEHPVEYAMYTLTRWPGLLTFFPDTIGDRVFMGARLTGERDPETNPVAYAFATNIGIGENHESWDVVAMYYVVRGLGDVYKFSKTRGEVYFFPNGSAAWNDSSPSRLQRVVDLKVSNVTLAKKIESILLWEP